MEPNKLSGPAFPVPSGGAVHDGMSLRDWFAGQALVGIHASLQASNWPQEAWHRDAATCAYMAADAMLAEREKRD